MFGHEKRVWRGHFVAIRKDLCSAALLQFMVDKS